MSISFDYGYSWTKLDDTGSTEHGDIGFNKCEFYGLSLKSFYYTETCYNTYNTIIMDEQYVFGQMGGLFPDVFRGANSGEVYVTSWFPDWSFKASFSADTGH